MEGRCPHRPQPDARHSVRPRTAGAFRPAQGLRSTWDLGCEQRRTARRRASAFCALRGPNPPEFNHRLHRLHGVKLDAEALLPDLPDLPVQSPGLESHHRICVHLCPSVVAPVWSTGIHPAKSRRSARTPALGLKLKLPALVAGPIENRDSKIQNPYASSISRTHC